MEFVERKQDAAGKKEYCYLKNVNNIDRKTLKKIGFKYKDDQVIHGIECEVWVRSL